MELYTEVITLKISKKQKETLATLKLRKVKVSHFIRLAIKEKINRDVSELIDKSKIEYCPFSNNTIILNHDTRI